MFKEEPPISIGFPAQLSIQRFSHVDSAPRFVFVRVPGPLVSSSIIVPTVTHDNSGLPHTLEHLIFCGSSAYPERGFLDILSSRSLSVGTNAYTCEDHTAYTITTAGQEGMAKIVPVFIDHILCPTLTDAQFMTEVCHLDGQGKYQGVVYCEMAARENSESDLMNMALTQIGFHERFRRADSQPDFNRLLETYTFECGGRTIDIRSLTNEDIKEYHRVFYDLNKLTVLIVGNADPQYILSRLEEHGLPKKLSGSNQPVQIPTVPRSGISLNSRESHLAEEIKWSNAEGKVIATKTVDFPSADDENGSIGFIWKGPRSSDLKTIVALEILLKCLSESSASVIHQQFVDGSVMYASDTDYDVKSYLCARIVFCLSGVPMKKPKASDDGSSSASDDDESMDGSEDDSSSKEGSDSSNDEKSSEEWFKEGNVDYTSRETVLSSYVEMFTDLLQRVCARGIPEKELKSTITKYRVQARESFEDDPHGMLTSLLTTDIVLERYKEYAPSMPPHPKMGSRLDILAILQELENEKWEYWRGLVEEWLLNSDIGAVIMNPSPALSKALSDKSEAEILERQKKLGQEKLQQNQVEVEQAIDKNKVNLSSESLKKMNGIPDSSLLPESAYQIRILDSCENVPYGQLQIVRTETAFIHLKIGLPTGFVSARLKPYFVLFQELLFKSSIRVFEDELNAIKTRAEVVGVKDLDLSRGELDYRTLIKLLAADLVQYECGIGIGNDTFSCSWLSDVFIMQGQIGLDKSESTPGNPFPIPQSCSYDRSNVALEKFLMVASWLKRILVDSVFAKARIKNIVSTLSSSLLEMKRDGSDCASQLSIRIIEIVRKSESWRTVPSDLDNEVFISMFTQEPVIEAVKKILTDAPEKIIKSLGEVQKSLAEDSASSQAIKRGGFVQIGVPASLDETTVSAMTACLNKIWEIEAQTQKPRTKKRLKDGSLAQRTPGPCRLFPILRSAASLSPNFKGDPAVLLPLEGITSSYLMQAVPLDFFITKSSIHPDYLPLVVLVSVLSIIEGPLFTGIRGKGYAYGSSLSIYSWNSLLVFEVSDASEPVKALETFWAIVESWLSHESAFPSATNPHSPTLISQFQVETTISSLIYRMSASASTPAGLLSEMLKCSVRGFDSLSEFQMRSQLQRVTGDDLNRVCKKYLPLFLNSQSRITVMTTPMDPPKEFLQASSPSGKAMINFEVVSMDDLKIQFGKDD